MDWLGPAAAIGLIVFVSGLVSAVQAFQRERRTRDVLRERGSWKAVDDRLRDSDDGYGHGHGYHHSPPALDDELHSKIDQLLERVPRSKFWRNTTWAIAGYGLAKLADFGLYYFIGF